MKAKIASAPVIFHFEVRIMFSPGSLCFRHGLGVSSARLVANNASTTAEWRRHLDARSCICLFPGTRLPGVIEYDEQPESIGGNDDTASSSSSTCGHAYQFCWSRERYGSSKQRCSLRRDDASRRYPFALHQQRQRHHLP